MFPPVMQTYITGGQTSNNCYVIGNSMNCTGSYDAPQQVTTANDLNEYNRNSEELSCMAAKGWHWYFN